MHGQLAGRHRMLQSMDVWSKSILPNYQLTVLAAEERTRGSCRLGSPRRCDGGCARACSRSARTEVGSPVLEIERGQRRGLGRLELGRAAALGVRADARALVPGAAGRPGRADPVLGAGGGAAAVGSAVLGAGADSAGTGIGSGAVVVTACGQCSDGERGPDEPRKACASVRELVAYGSLLSQALRTGSGIENKGLRPRTRISLRPRNPKMIQRVRCNTVIVAPLEVSSATP